MQHAAHAVLGRDRDQPLDLLGTETGRQRQHLGHRLNRIGISLDVKLRKRIQAGKQEQDRRAYNYHTATERECHQPLNHRCTTTILVVRVRPELRALSVRFVPQLVYLKRLTGDDAVAWAESRDHPRVTLLVPGTNDDLAPLEAVIARVDISKVVVGLENYCVQRYDQRLSRPHDDFHHDEHLRFELVTGILDLATDLERVRIGINVGADACDSPAEDFIRVSGSHRFELLSDLHTRQFVLVNVTGDPHIVEGSHRIKYVPGIYGRATQGLILHHGSADRRPHDEGG